MKLKNPNTIGNRSNRILLVLLLVLLIIIISFLIIGTIEDYFIDNNISSRYDKEIQPSAQKSIGDLIQKIKNFDDDSSKLRAISEWAQSNFIYAVNNKSFKIQDSFFMFSIIPVSMDNHYWKDDSGKWFIRYGKYAFDPMIITYFKAGGCGEVSRIANYTANLSGFVTREVYDPSGYHGWVEIKVGNDWFYYDQMIPPSNSLVKWFNSTNNRNQSSLIYNAARVFTSDGMDITNQYPPYGKLKINNIGRYETFVARWTDEGGKSFDELIDARGKSSVEVNLSEKSYTIFTPPMWSLRKTKQILIQNGTTTEISMFDDLKPISLTSKRIDLKVFMKNSSPFYEPTFDLLCSSTGKTA